MFEIGSFQSLTCTTAATTATYSRLFMLSLYYSIEIIKNTDKSCIKVVVDRGCGVSLLYFIIFMHL